MDARDPLPARSRRPAARGGGLRIHIVGGSGSGTTTLGAELANAMGAPHFDVDDYYWMPSDPPFERKRPPRQRLDLLASDLTERASWVLSGSLVSWGDPLLPLFDLVVFLVIPPHLRMERLAAREAERYGGEAIAEGGEHHDRTVAFFEWASRYEDPGFEGRSLVTHERWLASLSCPVLRLEGDLTTEERIARVVSRLRGAPGVDGRLPKDSASRG